MRLKIKVKRINKEIPFPNVIAKGEWVDLCASKPKRVFVNGVTYIPLGVAMQLPKGYEAIIVSRSSTPKSFGIFCANSFGVIDNSYCGDKDEWKFPASNLGSEGVWVKQGDRICQFRIQLSQKATIWQKLKWLLSSGIELIEVEILGNPDRGGIGSTGKR